MLVNAALAAANDNEKCRGNGVRALGNIVPICTTKFLEIESEALIKDIVQIVCKNIDSGAVKVCDLQVWCLFFSLNPFTPLISPHSFS